MTQYWEPGTEYNYGDVVEYQGDHLYSSKVSSLIGTTSSRCILQDSSTPPFSGEYWLIHVLDVKLKCFKSDWTPDITPALWGRTQNPIHQSEKYDQQQSWQQQQQQPQQQQQQQQQQPSWDYGKDGQGEYSSFQS